MNSFLVAAANLCAAAFLMCATAGSALAQNYPDKPVRLAVPYPAGGGTDFLARVLQPKLGEVLGQPVIVENKAGATGILGTKAVAQASADGYTLLMGNLQTLSLVPALNPAAGYDPAKDFVPISHTVNVSFFIVANPNFPAHTVQELVALAKSKPGKITYASSGDGSVSHLAAEMFSSMTGIRMLHVPYKGSGPALTDLLAGQVDLIFGDIPVFLPQVNSGKLRAVAVTGPKRSPLLPGVPTVAESGVPDYVVTSWQAILAPRGTPPEIVKKLNAAVTSALEDSAIARRLSAAGQDPVASTPQELEKLIVTERAKWSRVVQAVSTK